MIDLVARAGCVAVVGGICALVLRRYVPELSLVLGLVTAGVLAVMALGAVDAVRQGLDSLAEYAGLDAELTGPVLKVMVISILTRLMSQICRDAGESTLALGCELTGTFAALAVTMPLLRRVLGLIGGLMA